MLTLIRILFLAVRNFPSLLLSLIFLIRWSKPLLELNSFDDPALLVLKVKKRRTYYKLVNFHDGPIVDSIILPEVKVALVLKDLKVHDFA